MSRVVGGKRVGLFGPVVLSLLSAALVVGIGASASGEVASEDPGDVPTLCDTGSADGLSSKHGYMGAYVPPGATVTFHASGHRYGGGGQGTLYIHGSQGGQTVFDRSGIVVNSDTDGTGGFPFPYNNDYVLGSWTNNTGSDVPLALDFWAQSAGPGWPGYYSIDWSVSVQITGASASGCRKLDRSEFNGPNPALGQQCPSCHGGTDYSVDSLTGNEHWTLPGVQLESRGPGIDFEVAYNSNASVQDSSSIGYGWSHSYAMTLGDGAFGTKVVTQETGATASFISAGSDTWVAPGKFDTKLVHNSDGTWLFTRHRRDFFTFDASGKLLSVKDRNGYTTTLTYGASGLDHVADDAGHRLDFSWANGRIQTVTDSSDASKPRQMVFDYDTVGNLRTFTDVGNGPWAMTYDSSHRLTTVQSPRLAGTSAMREFHYDAQGRVDWEEDPLDRRTSLYYDTPQAGATKIVDPAGDARVDYYNAAGRRTSVTSGFGTSDASTEQFEYNAAGMVTKVTDGRGKEWKTEFTDNTNPFSPTKTTDPMGRNRTMTYTSQGDLDLLTDAHGSKTKYTYDANGNLLTTTVAYGTSAASTAQYNYADSAHPGDPTSLVDSRGKTWVFEHKPATGELTRSTDPLGSATTWTYNPEGWMQTRVDPRGNATGAIPANYTTQYDYNAFGQPKLITDALGHQTQISYDAEGNQTSVTDPTSKVVQYGWTKAGELETVTRGPGTADEQKLTYTYWPDGNIKTWSYNPQSVWTLNWDAQGRLSQETDPDGHLTTYSYDPDGRQTAVTTGAGTPAASTIGYTYDDDGRQATTTVGKGTSSALTTTTSFDVLPGTAPCTGGPAATAYCVSDTLGSRNTVRFYDVKDLLIQTRRPGGKTTTNTYNPAGAIATSTDPSNTQTAYNYDDAGRLLSKNIGTGATAVNVSYSYWPNGQRKSMTDSTGTTNYVYDRTGAITSVTDGAGQQVSYTPDNAGRPGAMTYPSGRVVTYAYNAAGQMSSLNDSVTGQTTTFGYDGLGGLKNTNFPNGDTIATSSTPGGLPDDITLKNNAGTQLLKIDYSFDGAGRIASQANSGALSSTTNYGYDPLGQLQTATNPATGATASYAFDAAGNPTNLGGATQAFDASDQLQTSTSGTAPTTYTHDGNGNRTVVSSPSRVPTSFGYDAAGRMTSATTPKDSSLYNPVSIARLVDTRNGGTGSCTPSPCAKIPAGGQITIQVGGNGGVPTTGVAAVVLGITTFNATSNGQLTAYPAGAVVPDGRSMSIVNGTTMSNAVITAVSADGKVTLRSNQAVDVLVEVSGWYSQPDGSGSTFQPLNTTRILDTRTATTTGSCVPSPCARLAADGTVNVQVSGQGGVPNSGVTAVAFTLTAFDPASTGSAVAWPANENKPASRNLSFVATDPASTLVVTKVGGQGKISLSSTKASDFAIDVVGYYTASTDGTGEIFVPYSGTDRRVYSGRDVIGTCVPSPCGSIGAGSTVTVNVAGQGPVPAEATTVIGTATVWSPSADGGLRLWPSDGSEPPLGRDVSFGPVTTSGAVQIDLGSQGKLKIKALQAAAVVSLDVDGWFLPPTEKTTYTYNGDGIRTSKTDPKGKTTRFVYDTSQAVPQLLTDGSTDYVYGPDGAPLAAMPNAGSTAPASYFMTDANGSVSALTNAAGAVSGTYDYSPFGAVTFHSGASTPLQYGGGYTDPETDLIYLLARYYDPSTGVFTTPDPLVDVTNQPYAYAGSDPINQTDPTGQCPMCAVLFVGFLSGAGTDLALQMTNNLANGCSAFQNISWGEVLASGVGGAAFDGLGYAVFKSIAYGYRTSSIAAETAGSKLPPAVIGEGMTARVAPYAEKNGYEIYAGVENPQNYTSEELLLHNKAQIETWMSEGRTIHDVGPAPGRDFYPMETSPNYGMEHNLVRGYPGYKPVVLPGEANWLELLGVH